MAETKEKEIELKEDGDFVLPGDHVAYAVELAPGDGAHEDGEFVRASWTGFLEVDTDNREVRVRPVVSTPVMVRTGQDVIIVVRRTRSSMVIGEVVAVAGQEERNVSGETEATLHISKISDEYVDKIEDAFRVGDIIRAKVMQHDPSIQVTTVGKEYGVLKAFCLRCRTPHGKVGKGLECPSCEFREKRKLSEDYGKGMRIDH